MSCTALHEAASHGHIDIVRFLVECGAVVGALDAEGQTPLRRAAANGHKEVVRFLLGASQAPARVAPATVAKAITTKQASSSDSDAIPKMSDSRKGSASSENVEQAGKVDAPAQHVDAQSEHEILHVLSPVNKASTTPQGPRGDAAHASLLALIRSGAESPQSAASPHGLPPNADAAAVRKAILARGGDVPAAWHRSTVVPLGKAGGGDGCDAWRPLAIASLVARTWEYNVALPSAVPSSPESLRSEVTMD